MVEICRSSTTVVASKQSSPSPSSSAGASQGETLPRGSEMIPPAVTVAESSRWKEQQHQQQARRLSRSL
uniref:Uncharacterized protein n=1 Tax=Oryza nivara TaxID=4536 RepID=A0A0E0G492_ORYNI